MELQYYNTLYELFLLFLLFIAAGFCAFAAVKKLLTKTTDLCVFSCLWMHRSDF